MCLFHLCALRPRARIWCEKEKQIWNQCLIDYITIMFGNFASTTHSEAPGGGSNTEHPCRSGRGPQMLEEDKYKQPVRSVRFSWSWGIGGTKDAQGGGPLSCRAVSIMQCASRPFEKLFIFTVSSYSSVFSGTAPPPEQRFSRSLVTRMLPTPWSFLSTSRWQCRDSHRAF